MLGNELGKLHRRNRTRLESCQAEDEWLIRKITGKLSVPQLSEFENAVVTQELLDMAEDARIRGETLQEALGVPPEEFCREVLENVCHTGWAGRALQGLRRFAANLFPLFLLAPAYWLTEYDALLLYQELTGKSLGLLGRWVMFLPVWLAAALVALMVVLELWNQVAEWKLAGRKWGQAVSIGFYLLALGVFLFGIHGGPNEGPLGGGTLFAMDLRVAVPVYLAVLLALELGYRLYISRIAQDYNWRK